MVSDKTLGPDCNPPTPPDLRARRSPILVLEDADEGTPRPRLADAIARRSAHAMALAGRPSAFRDRHATEVSASRAWQHLQVRFPAVCIGLVAERGAGIVGVSQILVECRSSRTLPGAIALLGFSRHFEATCVSLAGSTASRIERGGTAGRASRAGSADWSPMMFFLQGGDPVIEECAGACRRMRSAGIPIGLEIMRSLQNAPTEAVDELVTELDHFFATHLTPSYPERF